MKKYNFIFILLTITGYLSCQTGGANDSSQIILKSNIADSVKVQKLYKLSARLLTQGKFADVFRSTPKTLELARKLENQKWYAENLRMYAVCFERSGQTDSAIKYYFIVMDIAKQKGYKKIEGQCYHNIGFAQYLQSSFDKALKNYLGAVKIREELRDTVPLGWTQNNIGLIYWRQHSKNDALVHFKLARELFKRKKFIEGLAIATSNIGLINEELNLRDSAIYYYKESYRLNSEAGNQTGISLNLNNLGGIYYSKGEIDSAEVYFSRALEINTRLNNLEGLELNYRNMADVNKSRKKYDAALTFINKALQISRESEQPQGLIADYRRLSDIYALKGDYRSALEAHQKYAVLNDSLNFGDKLAGMEARYGKEKNEKEIALLKSENEVNELQLKRKQWLIYSAIGGFLFFMIVLFFVVRNNIQRKKVNLSLEQKNNEIVKQKEIIEEKSKDITDSILYAKRIQDAVLPDPTEFDRCFKDYFVIFEPRDIVSGDFYWLTQVNEQVVLIMADCTGHGVPGAFMSIIGHDILNQIIKEEKQPDPAMILSMLDTRLFAVLNKKQGSYSTNDGMDIAVCTFNTLLNTLLYSGAGRPLVIVNDNQLKLVHGSKHSVGGQRTYYEKQFENTAIKYGPVDSFYLMSDGFPDQFGGPKGKKFKSKQLNELLLSVSSLPMNEQKIKLRETFESWKGALEQVDDVCIIGVRL